MADLDPPTEPVPAPEPAAPTPAPASEPAPAAAVTASAPVTAPPAPRGRVFVRRPAPFILIGVVGLLLGCLIGGIGGLFVGHLTAGHGHGHGRPGYGPQRVHPQQPQFRRDRPGGQLPLPPRRQNQPSPAAPAPSAS